MPCTNVTFKEKKNTNFSRQPTVSICTSLEPICH